MLKGKISISKALVSVLKVKMEKSVSLFCCWKVSCLFEQSQQRKYLFFSFKGLMNFFFLLVTVTTYCRLNRVCQTSSIPSSSLPLLLGNPMIFLVRWDKIWVPHRVSSQTFLGMHPSQVPKKTSTGSDMKEKWFYFWMSEFLTLRLSSGPLLISITS